ncbi:zn-dependent protease with chaperone function [Leptolyngbya sp. Heron Island J]|uniref:M48 family metalloprotease n=1 Tax=Leptolyngbya sp. Heron Island J TaxID=1385935 RepID=UPI0003B9AD7E|nr:M48 family metalloprotease [Leptolyngbya sp. Heron Island J]ESA38052.1 zn-dependent protease with chaperone function [Leptolyngbya sp. Heron Island J]
MGLDKSPEQLIKVGLAALKQKDYERAISTFQQLSQSGEVSTNYRLKAQMGLIRAYKAQGNNVRAHELCQPLLNSRSPAIRQWAHDKVKQLDAEISPQQSHNISDVASGFVPETSGFVPFQSEPEGDTDKSADKPIKDRPSLNKVSNTESPSLDNISDSTGTHRSSLFHYQTLNRREILELEDGNAPKTPDGSDNNNPSIATTPSSSIATTPSSSIATTPSSSIATTPSPPPNPLEDPTQIVPEQSQDVLPNRLKSTANGPETWAKGDRLNRLKSLGKVSVGRLWFAQMTTIPILFLVVRWLVATALTSTGNYLQFLRRLLPINFRVSNIFWEPQYWTVLISLGILTIAATWLWPLLLRPTDQLTSSKLQTYSPEAVQLLRRLCAKRRWPFPKIQLISSELPLIFSYGWRPRYGQLVVSQGLLDQLEPDELAALIMYEMSHWSTLDWVFLSTHGLLLQGLHRAYWFLARWGTERSRSLRLAAGGVATLSYSLFWLLAKVGCGLARTRVPYRDRTTAELTGNPNGLVRALAKIAYTMTAAVDQQGYTPPLLESLDLMLPVGPHRAGKSARDYAWGALNPLRHWLSINQARPPLGDRLYTLSAYGRHWRLKPSLSFAHLQLNNGSRGLSGEDWRNLLVQGGAWSGLAIGLGIAVIMWLIGAIATSLDFPLLAWFYQDQSILIGIPLICAATGQLLRINPFFPEIADIPPTSDKKLTTWQTDPTLIPLSQRPIKISGTLTGRPDLANWLGQEWRLQTTQGSIALHYMPYLGPLSNTRELVPLLNQHLQVTGWFRRGHQLWIDIDQIQTQPNQIKPSQHPIWSVIISLISLSYGLWIIFRGG